MAARAAVLLGARLPQCAQRAACLAPASRRWRAAQHGNSAAVACRHGSRSRWKGPYCSGELEDGLNAHTSTTKPYVVYSRGSTILPEFVGKTVDIHNGKGFATLRITSDHVGHKFGSFSPTKLTPRFKLKAR